MTDFYGFPGGGAESAWNFDVPGASPIPPTLYPQPPMPAPMGGVAPGYGDPNAVTPPPMVTPAPAAVPTPPIDPNAAGRALVQGLQTAAPPIMSPGGPLGTTNIPVPPEVSAGGVTADEAQRGAIAPSGPPVPGLGTSLQPSMAGGQPQHVNPIEGAAGGSAGQGAGGPMDIRSGAQKAGGAAAAKPGGDKTQDTIKRLQEFMKAIQPAPRDVVKPTTPGLERGHPVPASQIGQIAALGRGGVPPATPAQLYLSRLLQGRG